MSHWLLDSLAIQRVEALASASTPESLTPEKWGGIRQVANFLEIAVLDMADSNLNEDLEELKSAALDARFLLLTLPIPSSPLELELRHLREDLLGLLAGLPLPTLPEEVWVPLPLESSAWEIRCQASLLDAWRRILMSRGIESVSKLASDLRSAQPVYEPEYLSPDPTVIARRAALELMAFYHGIKAAEDLAEYRLGGEVDEIVLSSAQEHLASAASLCDAAPSLVWTSLIHLLAVAFPILSKVRN